MAFRPPPNDYPTKIPRRRIPIEQEREMIAREKKLEKSEQALIQTLFGEGGSILDAKPQKFIQQNYLIPNSARVQKTIELKYNPDFCVYEDDPRVPEILETRTRTARDYQGLAPDQIRSLRAPKLVIPRPRPTNASDSARVHVPRLAEVVTKVMRKKPIADPNEFLHLYDDPDFDIGFIDRVLEQLKEGPVDGFSLFFNDEFHLEWAPCRVVSFEDPMFTIEFGDGSIKKEVHRISVRFAQEDEKRFEKRRACAEDIRKMLDADCKLTTYLLKEAEKRTEPSNIAIIKDTLSLLSDSERASGLISGMLTSVTESFIFAETVFDYTQKWNNEDDRKKFMEECLPPYEVYVPHLTIPDKLSQDRIQICLPDYSVCSQINKFMMDFVARDVVADALGGFQGLCDFREYFDEIDFHLKTVTAYAQSVMYRKLYNFGCEMAEGKSEEQTLRILTMVDFRLATGLADELSKTLRNITDQLGTSNVKFKVRADQFLETMNPSVSDFLDIGNSRIEAVYRTFETNPVNRISMINDEDVPIVVKTDSVEKSHAYAVNEWKRYITDDFEALNTIVNDIKKLTEPIPINPFEALTGILPSDIYAVLMNNESPSAKIEEISFERLKTALWEATRSLEELTLKYQHVLVFKFLRVDISDFLTTAQKRFTEFRDYIVRYLTAYGDHQLKSLMLVLKSLTEQMSKKSVTVEDWHNKKLLVEQIRANFHSYNHTLDFALSLIEFMSVFLFETEHSYTTVYSAKITLFKFFKSISTYENEVVEEKSTVSENHQENKHKLNERLSDFLQKLRQYHFLDACNDPVGDASRLDKLYQEFQGLVKETDDCKERDRFLNQDVTEYPIVQEIEFEFTIFKPLWGVGRNHKTTVEAWLSSVFMQVDVNRMTESLQDWGAQLKTVIDILKRTFDPSETNEHILHDRAFIESKLSDVANHPLLSSAEQVANYNKFLLENIPILKELCNPCLRGRHWNQISDVIGLPIDQNEGLTWNWIIESGIQRHLLIIGSISRSAKLEFAIEKSLQEMVFELQSLKLTTKEKDGVCRLEDPSAALELISAHRQKMQELFVPPYVQPFLSKITDYEIMANHFRNILKQTLEAQEKIDELSPAIQSEDIQAQDPNLVASFKDKIEKFNEFTNSFKASKTFHQILANERYYELTKELNLGLDMVKEDLKKVLERKRQIFPRFRLLSDSQLVTIISDSRIPSSYSELFSLMYPGMKEAVIDGEQECTGFLSLDGEVFVFKEKVWITHDCIEKWFLKFDAEIPRTIKSYLKELTDGKVTDPEKIALLYPAQVGILHFEILFAQKVTSCYQSVSNVFAEKKETMFEEQFTSLYETLTFKIKSLYKCMQSDTAHRISIILLLMMRQRDLVREILDTKSMSEQTILWMSRPKYAVIPAPKEDIEVTVTIGDRVFRYGFDYIGFTSPPSIFGHNIELFNSLALISSSHFLPMVCGEREIKKTNLVLSYAQILGRQAFVFPCVEHSSFEKIQKMVDNIAAIGSFLVLKDMMLLVPEVLNELSVYLMNNMKERSEDSPLFATYSIEDNSYVRETYRVCFRPVLVKDIDMKQSLKSIFEANGIEDCDQIAARIETLVALLAREFEPPLCSALTPSVIGKLLRESPINSEENLSKVMHERIARYFNNVMGFQDLSEFMDLLDRVFGKGDFIIAPNTLSILDHFIRATELYAGVILLGSPLAGKTTVLLEAARKCTAELTFISPLSFDFKELYGDTSSGILSDIIQQMDHKKKNWIVFDGTCENSWMDTLGLALTAPRRLYFCDGSTLNVPDSLHFVFETSDISTASPLTLSLCASIFVSDAEVGFEKRLERFISDLSHDGRIIEQISEKIMGSEIDAKDLYAILKEFSMFFVPKVMEFIETNMMEMSLTMNHYLNNYFTLLNCLILDYYYVDATDSLVEKHSASDLIKDSPHLAMFALFWSFASPFRDDERRKIDGLIHSMIASSEHYRNIFTFKRRYLNTLVFSFDSHQWEDWNTGLTASLFISNPNSEQSLSTQLTELTPQHLLIPESILFPTLYVSRCLLKQGKNIIFNGSAEIDKSVIVELCLRSPYATSSVMPTTYLFQRDSDHHLLRSMVEMVLPDTRYTPAFSLRKPLLALIDFDTSANSSAAELMRYIDEHGYLYNCKNYCKEATTGLSFLVTTSNKSMNQRLAHHSYVINLPELDNGTQIDSVTKAVGVLWEVSESANVIATSLLSLWREAKKVFSFNLGHLFQLIHRVAVVKQNASSDDLCNIITHEAVRVFYDATHSEQILAKINLMDRHLSKVLDVEQTNAFDIADRSLLTNINSPIFVLYEIDSDPSILSRSLPSDTLGRSLMKFTTTSRFVVKDNVLTTLDPVMRMDVLRLGRILSLPRQHAFIVSNLEFLPKKLVECCESLLGGKMHVKEPKQSLINLFHDVFIEAGKNGVHQYILIEAEELDHEEKMLMMSLLENFNVFNLFKRGELLQILTSLYSRGTSSGDPYNETTLESRANYNELTSQFFVNCVTHFHWVVADHPPFSCPEFINFTCVFQPYFATDIALKSYVSQEFDKEIVQIDGIPAIEPERFETLLSAVRLHEMFATIPYMRSFSLSEMFISQFISKYNALANELKEKTDDFSAIFECASQLRTFLKDTNTEMNNMENDLVVLTKEIEEQMIQLDSLEQVMQKQRDELEKETAVVQAEEKVVSNMQKECEAEIQSSKTALDQATNELRKLSQRDIAIVKGMNHPPRGVVLVVRAMCVVLGQDVIVKEKETDEEVSATWQNSRKVMNDPSFLSTMITRAFESLKPEDVNKLKIICTDPNFDPEVVEKSSSAAKSICSFIRALVPYYTMTETHQEKMKNLKNVKDRLASLQQQHEEAVGKLEANHRDSLLLQKKQADNMHRKESVEEQLTKQRERISFYSDLFDSVKPMFDSWEEQRREFDEFFKIAVVRLVMKEFYFMWSAPLDENGRRKLVSILEGEMEKLSMDLGPWRKYCEERSHIADPVASMRYMMLGDDNHLVNQKRRFHYPITEMWMETVKELSPENKRWLAVENLGKCPLEYLKRVCQVSSFSVLSAVSPTFEEDFVGAIRRKDVVLLFECDLSDPPHILIQAQQAISEGIAFVYGDDEFQIDSSFVVFFDTPSFVNLRIVRLDLSLVRIGFTLSDIRDHVSLALFESIDVVKNDKLKRLEASIFGHDAELQELRKSLKQFIISKSTTIFDNQTLQSDLRDRIATIKKIKAENLLLEKEQSELTANLAEAQHMADELLGMFACINPPEILWRTFEKSLAQLQTFDFDRLKVTMLSLLVTEFGFMHSLPIVSQVFKIPLDSFDNILQSIEKEHVDILFNSQSPARLIEKASKHRPVICKSFTTSWMVPLLCQYISSQFKYKIVSPNDCDKEVRKAASTGFTVITTCSTLQELNTVIASISFALSSKYLAPEFSFFIVLTRDLSDLSIFGMCEIVTLDQPLHFGATFFSSIQALQRVSELEFSKCAMVSLFDAVANVISKTVYNGIHYSFYDTVIASEFLRKNPQMDLILVGEFLINHFFASEFSTDLGVLRKVWTSIFVDKSQEIEQILNAAPKKSCGSGLDVSSRLTFSLDLSLFGLGSHANDVFKHECLSKWSDHKSPASSFEVTNSTLMAIEQKNVPCLWRNEKKIALVKAREALHTGNLRDIGMKLQHFVNHSDVADLPLLFDQNVFLNLLKTDYAAKSGVNMECVRLVLTSTECESAQKVTGLMCIGGDIQNGTLITANGFVKLPPLYLHAISADQCHDLVEYPLFFCGQEIASILVQSRDTPSAFFVISSCDT